MTSERKYDDGSIYQGEWNDDGHHHGNGHIIFVDGSHYLGEFNNGFFHGFGSLVFPDRSRYDGQFLNGKFHGAGVFQRADGLKFEGEFREGKIEGQGLVTFADGTNGLPRNEGQFLNNTITERKKCTAVIRQAAQAAEKAQARSAR